MQQVKYFGQGLLILTLISLAFMKLTSPYKDTYALPESIYYTTAVLEILLAVSLVFARTRPIGLVVITIFFIASIVASFMIKGDCG